jgi:hypothetical protein
MVDAADMGHLAGDVNEAALFAYCYQPFATARGVSCAFDVEVVRDRVESSVVVVRCWPMPLQDPQS